MTHEAGLVLVYEIAPIIRGAVPRVVRPIGCEDAAELVQDALCTAAQMIEASELSGKRLYPRSIAFYAIQRAKVGRRSGYSGETDAMSAAACLRRGVSVETMEMPASTEDVEDCTLHDILADPRAEDPSMMAARELDWAELMEDMNQRDVAILRMAAGQLTNGELSRRWGVSRARVSQLKNELGRQVKLRWGNSALADAVAEPRWLRRDVRCARERVACRRERQELGKECACRSDRASRGKRSGASMWHRQRSKMIFSPTRRGTGMLRLLIPDMVGRLVMEAPTD